MVSARDYAVVVRQSTEQLNTHGSEEPRASPSLTMHCQPVDVVTSAMQFTILVSCALAYASAYEFESSQFTGTRTLPADLERERAVEADVKKLYTIFPYPPRKLNIRNFPRSRSSDIPSISQFIFNGRRSFSADEEPLRVLVAGCGTGDNMLGVAFQLEVYSPKSELVCLELSEESQKIATARVELFRDHLQSVNITMIRDSILNIPDMKDLGKFDLINCFGVLHHIDNPDKALSILSSVLKPHGGMVLMIYGRYGRSGVYPLVHVARLLAKAGNIDPVSIEMAEVVDSLIGNLPPTNLINETVYWLSPWADSLTRHDILTFVANTYLHPRALRMSEDPSYTVDDAIAFLERAGLRMTSFMTPFRYEPLNYKLPNTVRGHVTNMSWLEQASFAEALVGNMIMHTFFVVKSDIIFTPPRVSDLNVYPLLRTECDLATAGQELSESEPEDLAMGIEARDNHGNLFDFPLPPLAAQIVILFDGKRTLAEVATRVFETVKEGCSDAQRSGSVKCYAHRSVVKQVAEFANALQSLGKVSLSRVPLKVTQIPFGSNRKKCNWMPSERQ